MCPDCEAQALAVVLHAVCCRGSWESPCPWGKVWYGALCALAGPFVVKNNTTTATRLLTQPRKP
jgi:hypothetical protein